MVDNNDAELSVGINDNLTPVLAKMAAQVRAFGNSIEAEAKAVDKAVASVTGSMARLGAAGTKNLGSQAYAKTIAQTTANLAKYRAEMERLAHVENAQTNKAGRKYDSSTGRLISNADLEAYDLAKTKVKVYSDELERLNRVQADLGKQRAWQDGGGGLPAHLAQAKAEAEGLSRSTKDLEKLYTGMFGRIEAVNGKATNWWPPQMLRGPSQFAEALVGMQNSVRYAMYDVSRNLALGGAALMALSVGAVVVAASWERSFADVERTVQGTPAMLERIRQGLVSLSQDIPVSFSNLAEIASVGGQMGIASSGIVQYTETIAKLTATTNLTADAASKALGRFKSFFAEAEDSSLAVTDQTFSNLASSILKVGVNSVATETGIVNVATQISSMAKYAGFTADQVIGLSGALASIGVPPELSRGVTTRLFTLMGDAVAEGGIKLQDFAKISGMTAAEFAAAWGTGNFAYVFTDFIGGLNSISEGGGDAVTALHELGITSVRDVPILQRLATAAGEAGNAGSLLAQTMNDARAGWRQNIELTLQYNKIADTLAERSKVLIQNFEALFAAMGSSAVGPVKDMVNGLINLVKGFTELTSTPAGQWIGGVVVATGALAGAMLLLAGGGARAFAAMQGLAAGLTAVTGNALVAQAAVRALGLATLGLGAVAAIAAVVGTIMALNAAADDANNTIVDTSGALAAMQADAEAGAGGLFRLGGAGSEAAAGMQETATQADILVGITSDVKDEMYGAADAATNFGERAQSSALVFGKASQSFAQNSLLASKAFTDLFKGEDGAKFGRTLEEAGFQLDKLVNRVAAGGASNGADYLEQLLGVTPNTNVWDDISNSWIWMDQQAAKTARSAGDLLNQVNGTVEGMKSAGSAALVAGDGFIRFTSATEMTNGALEDFQAQNEETINSMAEGFNKFVDTGALIGLTQQMKEAFATIDDGSTDVNEHADAIAQFETAWADAYGGAKFSIEEYMTTFRRAAGEQAAFITNLQTLVSRGVPTDIIADLAAMGPQAQALVEALVNSTDQQLDEYVALYQTTGFESMVAMAAGQLAAQQIVLNAAKSLSNAELRQLSADLSAGTPLTDAMAKWNLDAQGKPMKAPADAYLKPGWQWNFQAQMNGAGTVLPVTPYLTRNDLVVRATTVTVRDGAASGGYAYGGYTGPGGMFDPAGIVHRGEYVFPKSDVDQSSGRPTDAALMRMLRGGVSARHGGGFGYASGGFVSDATAGIVHLSVEDRMLLMEIRDAVGITIGESTVASLANSGNATSSQRRSA